MAKKTTMLEPRNLTPAQVDELERGLVVYIEHTATYDPQAQEKKHQQKKVSTTMAQFNATKKYIVHPGVKYEVVQDPTTDKDLQAFFDEKMREFTEKPKTEAGKLEERLAKLEERNAALERMLEEGEPESAKPSL